MKTIFYRNKHNQNKSATVLAISMAEVTMPHARVPGPTIRIRIRSSLLR